MQGGREHLHHKGTTGSAPSTSHSLQLLENQQFAPTPSDLLDAVGIPSQRKGGNLNIDANGETFRAVTSATNDNMLSGEKSPNDPADEEEQSKKRKRCKKEIEVSEMSSTSRQRELELAQDESIDCAPFRFKPYQLAHMLDLKDLGTLTALGGTDGIIHGLGTHPEHGLTTKPFHTGGRVPPDASYSDSEKPDLEVGGNILSTKPNGEGGVPSEEEDNAPYSGTTDDRKQVYGENFLPIRTSKTLLQLELMAVALKDYDLTLAMAVLSLDFYIHRDNDKPPVHWEVVAVILTATIFILVDLAVGSLNDRQKERQFKTVNKRKEERGVKVIRDGIEAVVDIKEVVVGDIALVEPGEIISCDGIFISGHNIKCDESGATGESEAIKKIPYADVVKLTRNGCSSHADCFMISGSKVIEGVGKYVVIAVGTKSFNGRIMRALRTDTEDTPLQIKHNILAGFIAKIGIMAALTLFRYSTIDINYCFVSVIGVAALVAGARFFNWWKRQSKGLNEHKREHGIPVIGVYDVERFEEVQVVEGNTTLLPETIPCCSNVEIVSQAPRGKRKRRKRSKKSNESLLDKDDVSGKVLTYLYRILLAKENRNAASEYKVEASDAFARVSETPPAPSIRGTLSAMLLNPAFDTGADMSITRFCENYGLRPEINSKLDENGYDYARNFRFVTLDNLTEMGFNFGERAMLQDAVERWAVRRP